MPLLPKLLQFDGRETEHCTAVAKMTIYYSCICIHLWFCW